MFASGRPLNKRATPCRVELGERGVVGGITRPNLSHTFSVARALFWGTVGVA